MKRKNDSSKRPQKEHFDSAHLNEQYIPSQHGELAVSMAMANLISIRTARIIFLEALNGMHTLATKSINWTTAKLRRNPASDVFSR